MTIATARDKVLALLGEDLAPVFHKCPGCGDSTCRPGYCAECEPIALQLDRRESAFARRRQLERQLALARRNRAEAERLAAFLRRREAWDRFKNWFYGIAAFLLGAYGTLIVWPWVYATARLWIWLLFGGN